MNTKPSSVIYTYRSERFRERRNNTLLFVGAIGALLVIGAVIFWAGFLAGSVFG